MFRATASRVVALLLCATPVFAQAGKALDVHIGGGYTFTGGEVRDHLGDGYNVNVGFTFNVGKKVGLQAEYSFNGLGQKDINVPVSIAPGAPGSIDTPFTADMNMQYGNVNVVFKPLAGGRVSPYLLAGLGLYYRPIKITSPGVGYVPGYCDPWWYVCIPGGWIPVENVVGERSSTDFGMDVGGGINIGSSDGVRLYIEARYHYIWGPEVKTAVSTSTKKANGQFLPITIGVRF